MFVYILLLSVIGSSFCVLETEVYTLPGGERFQSAGFRFNPAWGSVSQQFNSRGFGSPQTFSGGLDFTNPNGHGVSIGGSKMNPGGKSIWALGNVAIINTPNHKMDAWAKHQQDMSKFGKSIKNSGGLNYKNVPSGANVFGSVSETVGQPASATIGASVPITDNLSVGGSRTMTPGQKPTDQVQATYSVNF